jgi:formylglycine-generating enzyme required for sulfatase activity
MGCTQIAGYDGYVFDRCGPLETYHNGLCVATLVQVSSAFAMDATEVTRSQYDAWLETEPSLTRGDVCDWNGTYVPTYGWPPGAKGDHPVVGVDWCDALQYCYGVGKRLCGTSLTFETPQESEWYKACVESGASAFAGACNTNAGATMPVGSNDGCQAEDGPYGGIFDLVGNVWEWDLSCQTGLKSQAECHVRGGHSSSGAVDCDTTLRLKRDQKNDYVGFRCCWSP